MKASRSIATALLLMAVLGSATRGQADAAKESPAQAPAPAFTVGLAAAPDDATPPEAPLPALLRAVYEIDVYGGMAVGTLEQEFSNVAETERFFVYTCAKQGEVELTAVTLESPDRAGELRFEAAETRESASQRDPKRPTRHPAQTPVAASSGLFVTETFPVPGEERFIVRSRFQLSLPVEGSRFHLTLPALFHGVFAGQAEPARGAVASRVSALVRIVVTVHHDQPLYEAQSRTHQILTDFVGDRTIIEPVQSEVPGAQPFAISFATNSSESPTIAGYMRRDDQGRQGIETVVTPPETPLEQTVRPKQILFVIDSSGSMAREEKMAQARRAVASCVKKLAAQDRFNVVEFDTDFTMYSPVPVEPAEVERNALDLWLGQLAAEGGTKLLPALEATLTQPDDPDRHRMIVVVTDGILSDEQDVLHVLEKNLGEGRLFVVGTGKQIRQETLLRLAEYGRGAATFAGDAQSLESAVTELFDSIADPLGWDVHLDFAGADVEEIVPSRLPDLYAGRPVRVLAWFRDELPTSMALRMATTEGERLFSVKLPPRQP